MSCHSLTSSQLTLPPACVLKSILYVCIFIPVLPLGSSEPFFYFFRFHIYVLAYGICFSLIQNSEYKRNVLSLSTCPAIKMEGRRADERISEKYPTWFTPLISQNSHMLFYSCVGFQTTPLVEKMCSCHSYKESSSLLPKRG